MILADGTSCSQCHATINATYANLVGAAITSCQSLDTTATTAVANTTELSSTTEIGTTSAVQSKSGGPV